METSLRPFTSKQRKELEGIVSPTTRGCGALMFLAAAAVIGGIFRFLQRVVLALLHAFADTSALPPWLGEALTWRLWWLVPMLVCALWLYKVSGRWTGGRELRDLIRQDLAAGQACVTHVRAVDAIKVEEIEDKGPTFFLKLEDGRILALAGQHLIGHTMRGFPWQEMEIIETPHSQRFLGLKKLGAPLRPSTVLAPSSWDEVTALQPSGAYELVDVDFENLRSGTMKKLAPPPVPGEDVTELELTVCYHDGTTPVQLGDRVRARSLLRWRAGCVTYVPGISPLHPELEHDGLLWIGVARDDGLFTSAAVDPGSGRLGRTVELVQRGSAADLPPVPEAPFD